MRLRLETHIFDGVRSNLDTNAARLTVALGLAISAQQRLVDVVESRARTNQDRDLVFAQVVKT